VSDRPESKKAELTAASDLQAGRDIYIGSITQIVNQSDPPKPAESPQISLSIDALVEQVRSLYRDKIRYECGKMQFINRQVPIDNLYTDVYILEDIPHQRFADISERVRDFDPTADDFNRFYLGKVRQERVPGLDVVEDECKLMCLGAPGSGKTTYLFYVATHCNEGKLQPDRVPVFIRLIEYADKVRVQPELNLLNHIDQLFQVEGVGHLKAAETLLKQGRVLVLLDGLDEVPQVDSRLILTQIREFCRTYYKNSIIVTCRTKALDYRFENLGFTQNMVADFDQKQIEIFAHNWFVAFVRNDSEAGKAKAKQFIENLQQPENKRIRDLAVTPILLNLTCLVFQDIGNFPSNRAKLYQQGLNILLEEWDSSKGVQREQLYGNLSVKEKEALLAHVAAMTFTQNRYFFEQGEIEGHLVDYLRTLTHAQTHRLQQDSETVLKAIEVQHGLLVERAQEVYSFSHLTFQEYFTAKWFVDRTNWQSLVSHIIEKRWREVCLLAASMMQSADELLLLMKQKIDEILALDKKLQKVLMWVNHKAISVEINYKKSAIRAFYLHCIFDGINNCNSSDFCNLIDNAIHCWHEYNAFNLINVRGYVGFYYKVGISHSFISFDGLFIDFDYLNYSQNFVNKLHQDFHVVKNNMPESNEDDGEFINWCKTNYIPWIENLRAVIIEHKNFFRDWQFSDKQIELLQQYYDANKLLVECLNSGCVVSDGVREQIEETLLLPIAEIERQNNERS